MADCARRDLLKGAIGLGLGLARTSRAAARQDDRASARPQEGDWLINVDDQSKRPLTVDDVKVGAMPVLAWPLDPSDRTVRSGSRFNQVLLLRLDTATLTGDTPSRAADGVVAYTAICTHSGCNVDDWIERDRLLSCSCHESVFDPRDGARVVDGPAPRPLPALPLKIVDGKLVVAKPFTDRVGFDTGG